MSTSRQKSAARMVTVDPESVGRRLDNFLLSELKGLPRTRIYSMIRKGEVRINKGRCKAGDKLKAGDQVRIPPVSLQPKPLAAGHEDAGHIEKFIVHEDDVLLVLNKPSGMAVHGGSGISTGVIERLRLARPDSRFMELVHRLDRDTSGLLLVAKKRSALRKMHEAFREGNVDKRYEALLLGNWQGGSREVDLPLVVEHRRNGERHVRPGDAGKPARTVFVPRDYFADYVFVDVELYTGRTHQIRAHAAAIGHPVAGDSRYGDRSMGPAGLKRLFLHAAELSFIHPKSEQRVSYRVPLEKNLQALVDELRFQVD
ncbi:MAG: RluA family pseudouridine synthase [Gammaproteobacteria bacterium]